MNKRSDYEAELERAARDIAEFGERLAAEPGEVETNTKLAYRLFQRACLTGDASLFAEAERAVARALKRFGPQEDLVLLKTEIDFKYHRLFAIRKSLEMAPALLDRPEGRAILGDLDFQQGRYDAARAAYEACVAETRNWHSLARLAHLEFKMGRLTEADRLYHEAEGELTAKQMRSFAWLELQRGVLDLSQGRFAEVGEHYERAGRAYGGFWLVDEHRAELLGAQGEYQAAVVLYESVVARVPKPEYQQALGELYCCLGQRDQAERCFESALAAYLKSVHDGEVQYYHHLADFYADVREDGPEAVRWARMDLALRENFATQAALAWALFRAGEHHDATDQMEKALSSGAADARLFHHAGLINEAGGHPAKASELKARAAGLNPHHACFHVHR